MIIGFTGKAGAGKTTIADMLMEMEPKSVKLSFAEPLKRIARLEFGWDGAKDDKGRRLLQVLGTEAGRGYKDSIWVDKFMELAERSQKAGTKLIVVDDVRFDNEAEAIIDSGGLVIKVEGRDMELGENSGHASEAGVSVQFISFYLNNSGAIDHLKNFVADIHTQYFVDDEHEEVTMIYIASPYSHPDDAVRVQRFEDVCKMTAKLMREGKMVFSPIAHSHPLTSHGAPGSWEYWKVFDMEMLKFCAELYVLMLDGWMESTGVQAEIEVAKGLNMPIIYLDQNGI